MRFAALKAQIDDINEHTTPLAVAFSQRLGVGSRSIQTLLMIANLLTAALLILLGIWRTRNLLIQRQRFEFALQAEKERAQVTLSSIGEAVISTDASGCVEYMNPTAERLVDRPAGEAQLIGRRRCAAIDGRGRSWSDRLEPWRAPARYLLPDRTRPARSRARDRWPGRGAGGRRHPPGR
jgi:PAS domain-containing protein